MLRAVLLAVLAAPAYAAILTSNPNRADEDPYAVPKDLLIGAGVSAIQTEGAWNTDGKGESAADYIMHLGKLARLGFGDPHEHDVAADSYHRYKEDVAMAAKLKLKLYRFSISWSRVLPTANASEPNALGVQYYDNLIDEIVKHNMTPMATLYHFDHPQILEEQFHGWQGQEMVAKFQEYARFVFSKYASKVKLWTTINEPNMYCAYFPVLFNVSGFYTTKDMDQYQCMRNTILAHGAAYRAFHEDGHQGQVGFTALLMSATPSSTQPEDVFAADAFNQLNNGFVLYPVVYGDYSTMVKELLGDKLVPFTDAEKKLINGTSDFIGLNIYFRMYASFDPTANGSNPISKIPLLGTIMNDIPFVHLDFGKIDSKNPFAIFSMMQPDAIRSGLLWTWENFKLPIVITENGMGDTTGLGKHDHQRAVYHSAFLRTLVQTMKQFKVKVIGYCTWSLIDSFEWSAGYKRPFGLVHVDYEGGSLNRSLKDSAQFWIDMADSGIVPLVSSTTSTASATSCSLLLLALLLAWFN